MKCYVSFKNVCFLYLGREFQIAMWFIIFSFNREAPKRQSVSKFFQMPYSFHMKMFVKCFPFPERKEHQMPNIHLIFHKCHFKHKQFPSSASTHETHGRSCWNVSFENICACVRVCMCHKIVTRVNETRFQTPSMKEQH